MADRLSVDEMAALLGSYSKEEIRKIIGSQAAIPLAEQNISMLDAYKLDAANSRFMNWLSNEIIYRAAVRRENMPAHLIALAQRIGWGNAAIRSAKEYPFNSVPKELWNMEAFQASYLINPVHNFTKNEETKMTWYGRGEEAIELIVKQARDHNAFIRKTAKEYAERGEEYRGFYSPVRYRLDENGEPQRHDDYDSSVDPEPDGEAGLAGDGAGRGSGV